MPKKSRSNSTKPRPSPSAPFHERFNLRIGDGSARRRFLNRITNYIWDGFFQHDVDEKIMRGQVLWQIANDFGEEYEWDDSFEDYIKGDYYRCLHALESAYHGLNAKARKADLSGLIETVLSMSEIDLGIEWRKGVFIRTGARELDEALVNVPLEWLADDKYSNLRRPFQKGLSAFLESDTEPMRRTDVIRDMYEALAALAKLVTGRPNRDLSANAEMFIRAVDASEQYKRLLKEYIAYANTFRHGLHSEAKLPEVSSREVESIIYLTGIFIRMVMT